MGGALQARVAVECPTGKIGEHRDLRVEQSEIDVPSTAGTISLDERRADRERSREAATVVHVGDAGLCGRTVGLSREAHRSCERLDGVVVPRPLRQAARLTEASERT